MGGRLTSHFFNWPIVIFEFRQKAPPTATRIKKEFDTVSGSEIQRTIPGYCKNASKK